MWRVLGSVLAWQMTASICYYAVFAATPFLREVFGLSRFSVGLVVTALTLGQLVFLLPVGAAVDGYGERRMLIAGLGGLSVGTVGIGIAWSFPVVTIAAFGLGAAYAVSMPGTNRAVFESIPPARRNLGMGIKQVGVTAGSACSSIAIPAFAVAGATAPQLAVVVCLALGFVMFGFTNVFFSAVGLFAQTTVSAAPRPAGRSLSTSVRCWRRPSSVSSRTVRATGLAGCSSAAVHSSRRCCSSG
jgi:MFS family permease